MGACRILEGRNAIVTGSNRGIGLATVRVFAQMGANVWACARRPGEGFESQLRELSESYGVWMKPCYFDVTDAPALKRELSRIRKDGRPIDILVNNAGTVRDALLPMVSLDEAHGLFDVNFFATVRMAQVVSRIMTRQGNGCIINVSSYLAEEGNRGQSMYAASKAAVEAFTRSLAKELAGTGVRVNAIAPGIVDTDLIRTMDQGTYEENMRRCALGRPAMPEEIAKAIAALASDLCSYVNGTVLRADGCLGA